MDRAEIADLRLRNQRLTGIGFERPGEAVRWLGAVQAQDYPGALRSVGLRTEAPEPEVERAILEKSVVRTWPMRGTLHFVPPEDIRWMLRLLAVRTEARSAGRYRQLGLDGETFSRSGNLLAGALSGGKALTRSELFAELERGGIPPDGQRGIHILAYHARDGLICYGPRRGKQHTFVLLDEWIPRHEDPVPGEALGGFALRYFTGHGPATLRDFVWWTGLKTTDARAALEAVKPLLARVEAEGVEYWTAPVPVRKRSAPARLFLLPGFDEYLLGYTDRSAVLHPDLPGGKLPGGNGMFSPTVVLDGQVIGTWSRSFRKGAAVIEPKLLPAFPEEAMQHLYRAVERYGRFYGSPAVCGPPGLFP